MARSLEELDDVLRSLEQGSLSALEAIHQLLAELTIFNDRLVQMIRTYKPREIKYKVEQAAARLSGNPTDRLEDPTRAEFAKRNEISSPSATRSARGTSTSSRRS